MNRLLLFSAAFAACVLFACNKDEEITRDLPPEIVFEEDQALFTVKTGREVRIAPGYAHAEGAAFRWTIDGVTVGTERAFVYTAGDEPTTVYLSLTVTARGGTATEEIRIDVVGLYRPLITLPGADEGFELLAGASKTFSPTVADALPVDYAWSVNGEPVGTEREYTFQSATEGTFTLSLQTTNEDGEDRVAFSVSVYSEENLPFRWSFDQTEFNMTAGRTIRIAPVALTHADGAVYTWSVNGEQQQTGGEPGFTFAPTAAGDYAVTGVMTKRSISQTAQFTVHVFEAGQHYRKATASSRAAADKVCEFVPAPGQFVNDYGETSVGTPAEACAFALRQLANNGSVSLGAFGGYIVVGFDHSIDAAADGSYDLAVSGNSFDGGSEPGIVWVMQDENGDGQPNDTWYELRGSAYDDAETLRDYAVTYTYSTGDIPWRDNRGGEGVVARNFYHAQESYYPAWIGRGSYTLRGTRLKARNSVEYSETYGQNIWVLHHFAWGYADNFGSDMEEGWNRLRIADAVDHAGDKVDLAYIDFVKIQSAILANCGPVEGDMATDVGELSTEVSGIADYARMK